MAGQYDRIVAPGESGKIPLKIHTGKMSGKMSKAITVNTNIPGAEGTITLRMDGETWVPIEITPRVANFGRLTTDQIAAGSTLKMTVVNNLEKPVTLGEVKSNNPLFKPEIKELEPGKKYELSVTLQAPADKPLATGNINGSVTLTTGLPDSPTEDVAINLFVTPSLEITPDTLTLLSNRTGETKRPITVKNNSKKPIKISELTATSPDLKVELQELEPGVTYRINVDIPTTYKAAPSGDKIIFKTDSPAFAQMTIPVVERVMPQASTQPAMTVSPVKVPTTTAPGPGLVIKPAGVRSTTQPAADTKVLLPSGVPQSPAGQSPVSPTKTLSVQPVPVDSPVLSGGQAKPSSPPKLEGNKTSAVKP